MELDPVLGSAFFGRREICVLFDKRLEAFRKGYRQNIGIIGAPCVGKSSLVQNFLMRTTKCQIVTVLLSCKAFDSFERFSQRWMGKLLLSLYRQIYEAEPRSFQELVSSLRRKIPKTLRHMKEVQKLTLLYRHYQAYRKLLNLSALLREESGNKFLLIFDDFDHLEELDLNDPFSTLGQEIMVQKDTMYVVTSSSVKRSWTIFHDKLSLLFGNFEVIKLDAFDFEEASSFIDERFPERSLEKEMIRFLIRLTDGHPYYLDLLTKSFRGCLAAVPLLSNKDLTVEVLAMELFGSSGMLHQHFRLRLSQLANGKPWPFYGDVLAAIAIGHKRLSQVARFLHFKGNDVKKVIDRLLQMEVVEKHGSLFLIPDPLFRFWLAHVYYSRRFLLETSFSAGKVGFQAAVSEAIEKSMREDQKELPKRIEELFRKFRNDVVELNQRKFKCPHFTEVISHPNNGRVFPVIARNEETRWLCQVLSTKVTEEDIHVFLEDTKRLRSPIQKKLILGLDGIDLNAKLLAHEAKIQYLDLKSFNFLLDLYDKPKLVF